MDKSIERFTTLLTLINKTNTPRDWAATQSDLGKAVVVSGARFGDHPKIDRGIAAIRAAQEIRTFERSPDEWVGSQIDLAEALIAGGRISATNTMLEEAIQICRTVVDKKSDAGIEDAQFLAKSVMGNALQQLGQRENDAGMILGATNVTEDALSAIKRDKRPFEWAQGMNYLANSNREMGRMQKDASLLLLAVEQYEQSLDVRTRDTYPTEWAQTQLDLGNAYSHLADLQNDASMAERAMNAFRKSFEVRTEKTTPLEWGMSRNNYGASLDTLLNFKLGASVADFSNEVSAYRDALRVTTRERAPLDWAMMQFNLGLTLVKSWKRKQIDLPKETQAAMDALMQNQVKHPRVDGTAEHEAALAMIMKRSNSVDELKEAINAFHEAKKEYTKEAKPLKWLNVQHEIAQTLQTIGSKLLQSQKFEEAIEIYREEQTVLQRQYAPAEWAGLQNNIAGAMHRSGIMKSDPARLRDAAKVYQEAIEAVPGDQPFRSMYMKNNLADLKCHLGEIDSDKTAIDESVRLYRELKQLSLLGGETTKIDEFNKNIADCVALANAMTDSKAPN